MRDRSDGKSAPGTTPALPTDADLARNEHERKQAIGAKARRLVREHIEAGRVIQSSDLQGFGPDGSAYFSRVLKAAIKAQLDSVQQEATPDVEAEKPTATGMQPHLAEIEHWNDRHFARAHYSARPLLWALFSSAIFGVLCFFLAQAGVEADVYDVLLDPLNHVQGDPSSSFSSSTNGF